MTGDPRIDGYAAPHGREAMLRFGPDGAPVAVLALPLLEEANRTRALAGTLLRLLASHGIAGALPDLPGTGESPVGTDAATLAGMRRAFAAAVGHCGDRAYAVSVRSGVLLDTCAQVRGRWHLSPVDGAATLREWRRIAAVGGFLPGGSPGIVAGNAVSERLLEELVTAVPVEPARTLRLDGDAGAADRHVAGAALWRRSEPGNDPALAATLADDVASWIARCER